MKVKLIGVREPFCVDEYEYPNMGILLVLSPHSSTRKTSHHCKNKIFVIDFCLQFTIKTV
jgi:hypothetical protein